MSIQAEVFGAHKYSAHFHSRDGLPDLLFTLERDINALFPEQKTISKMAFSIEQFTPQEQKDRKGRTLNFEDILHYQKIVVALSETDRIMKEIDKIEIE